MEAATRYQIHIQGRVDEVRLAQFAVVSFCYINNDTLITAVLPDQSALYGFLNRLRDLSVTLISLQLLEDCPASATGKTNRGDAEDAET